MFDLTHDKVVRGKTRKICRESWLGNTVNK